MRIKLRKSLAVFSIYQGCSFPIIPFLIVKTKKLGKKEAVFDYVLFINSITSELFDKVSFKN